MRYARGFILIGLIVGSVDLTAQHQAEISRVRGAMQRLEVETAELASVLDRDVAIAEELYQAILVVAEDQEHNAAEKAMARVRAARRLVEEGPRDVHVDRIVGVAQEMVLNRREWIHSVDLYDMREEYHHRVIHPLVLVLAEDLDVLAELELDGFVLGDGLLQSRRALTGVQRRLLNISDLRYREPEPEEY